MSNIKYRNSPLATLMSERGLNQSDLSRCCGVSQPTLSRFLKGGRGMSVSNLMKVSNFFSVDMGTLCASQGGVSKVLLSSSLRPDLLHSCSGKNLAGSIPSVDVLPAH